MQLLQLSHFLPVFLLLTLTSCGFVRAVVQPARGGLHSKLVAQRLRLHGANVRQESNGGYSLDNCRSKKDCLAPRHCFYGLCAPDKEDDRVFCSSCAECPGFPNEVCANDPDAGVTCVSAIAAADFHLEFAAGCEGASRPSPIATPRIGPEPPKLPMEGPMAADAAMAPGAPPPAESTASEMPSPMPEESMAVMPSPMPEESMAVMPSPDYTNMASSSSSSTGEMPSSATTTDAPDTATVTSTGQGPIVVPSPTPMLPTPESTDESADGTDSETGPTSSAQGATGAESSDAPNASSSSSQEETEVCIAVEHLQHLPAHALVFDRHRRARVLCDMHGSCATAGHMVVFRDRPMMMRSYCGVTHGGCAERATLVNSPRFRPAVKVMSRTKELHFTALAARYASRIEEHILKMVIRSGL